MRADTCVGTAHNDERGVAYEALAEGRMDEPFFCVVARYEVKTAALEVPSTRGPYEGLFKGRDLFGFDIFSLELPYGPAFLYCVMTSMALTEKILAGLR
jgi:hypothetical protein